MFCLHLIADVAYELPVDFVVTKASNSEVKETEKLLKDMEENHPEKIEKCRYFLADRGYDSTDLIEWLETEGISPIIDIRNCWKDGEDTKQFKGTDLVYSFNGKVYFVDGNGEKTELLYKGYDKSGMQAVMASIPSITTGGYSGYYLRQIPGYLQLWRGIQKNGTGCTTCGAE